MKEVLEFVKNHYQEILAGTIGIYEVIARIWPSVDDHTVIGKLLKLLVRLSDFFNRKSK